MFTTDRADLSGGGTAATNLENWSRNNKNIFIFII